MLFNDYLKITKKNNNFTNALIVNPIYCTNYKEISKNYLKSMVCKCSDLFCDECNDCLRINQDFYVDYIYIKNDESSSISKEDIINIQNQFYNSSTESSEVKLYTIKNIENSNKQVINSLLKFIEESPKNTYCLLISENPNRIIETIKSRSNFIKINDNNNLFKDNKHANILELMFNDYNEYLELNDEIIIEDIIELAYDLVNNSSNIEKISSISFKLQKFTKQELSYFIKSLIYIDDDINKKKVFIELLKNLNLYRINQRNIILQIMFCFQNN